MGTLNRFYGTFFGLAVGDAIGAQTHGVAEPGDVPLIDDPGLAWTDQTQHFAHTARALVSALAHPYDRRVVGRAIASELVDWYHDPTTAGRFPGRSSLGAVVRLLEGADWETSGNPDSDGADPLPRAVAVGLAWPPDLVVEPALTATSVTHRHPTALQAAVITAWLVSSLARGAALGFEIVEEACKLGAAAVPEGTAIRSVGVALDLARRHADTVAPRIDPRMVPPGDGGQRSGSAIGLAVLLALALEGSSNGDRYEKAVAAAARIPGGPEVVAALVGALLGAAYGLGAVPRDFVEDTEERETLVDLARALHVRAIGLGVEAEHLGRESDLSLAWEGAADAGRFLSLPTEYPESATDTEWNFGEPPEVDRPRRAGRRPVRKLLPRGERESREGVQWIRVADEDLAEMEAADADLLAEVRRRW